MTVPLEDPDVTTEFRKVAARETVDDGILSNSCMTARRPSVEPPNGGKRTRLTGTRIDGGGCASVRECRLKVVESRAGG